MRCYHWEGPATHSPEESARKAAPQPNKAGGREGWPSIGVVRGAKQLGLALKGASIVSSAMCLAQV